MATLTDAAALAVDAGFLARVTAGVLRYATELSASLYAMPSPTPLNKLQLALCKAVMLDPDSYGSRFAWTVACVESISVSSTDQDIATQIAIAWNLVAGVTF